MQVMRELRWADMRSLLSDEDPQVQEHALALLRNLCMHSAADVQAVVAWAQGELVPALEDKMDPSSSRWVGVAGWCVYVVCVVVLGCIGTWRCRCCSLLVRSVTPDALAVQRRATATALYHVSLRCVPCPIASLCCCLCHCVATACSMVSWMSLPRA
jgi:hypothetical protein